MELVLLVGFIFIFYIFKFIWNWIKVKIYLISFGSSKNSFLMTITYMMSKKDIETIIKNKKD